MTKRQLALDLAIAGAIGVGCTLEVWAPKVFGSTHMNGPRAAVFASYVVAVAALALRRRRPLAVAVVVATALAIEWVIFGSPEGFGVVATVTVASYAVAAYEDRLRALLGLGALLAAGLVWNLRDPVQTNLHKHLVALAWLSPTVIAWLLGAYQRTRRLYVAELHERADRADREREERAQAAVAEERARIARELHDIVAHNVSVMVVQAEAADEMLERDRPERARGPVLAPTSRFLRTPEMAALFSEAGGPGATGLEPATAWTTTSSAIFTPGR